MYPMVMFSTAMIVMVFMLIKVVPVFAKMYDGMGIPLPTPTRVIMNASDFMRGSGGLTLLISLTIFYFVFKYLRVRSLSFTTSDAIGDSFGSSNINLVIA